MQKYVVLNLHDNPSIYHYNEKGTLVYSFRITKGGIYTNKSGSYADFEGCIEMNPNNHAIIEAESIKDAFEIFYDKYPEYQI